MKNQRFPKSPAIVLQKFFLRITWEIALLLLLRFSLSDFLHKFDIAFFVNRTPGLCVACYSEMSRSSHKIVCMCRLYQSWTR